MPKRKSKPRTLYSMEQRSEAIELTAKEGLAEAARRLHIPKPTIYSWCRQEQVTTATPALSAQTAAASKTSVAIRTRTLAETRERLVALLSEIAELAGQAEIQVILSGEAQLRDLVGARTRAIHDLQLLEGKATERADVNMTTTDEVVALQRELQQRLEIVS